MSNKYDKFLKYEDCDGQEDGSKKSDISGKINEFNWDSEYKSLGVPDIKYSSVNQNYGKESKLISAIRNPGKYTLKNPKKVSINVNVEYVSNEYVSNENLHDKFDNQNEPKYDKH